MFYQVPDDLSTQPVMVLDPMLATGGSMAHTIGLLQSRNAVDITATCKLAGKTGVEMEALTAVAVAALTVYDMCKAVDRGMRLSDIRLVQNSGRKSGTYTVR